MKPLLNTTQIGKIFGFHLSADFIENELGIEPEFKTKRGVFWEERAITYISYQLSQHTYGIGEDYMYGNLEVNNV